MLKEWRHWAANALLAASAVVYVPAVAILLAGYDPRATWPVVFCATAAYLVVSLGALRRRTDYRLRVWAMLVAGYVAALVGGIGISQAPFPRALLIVLPVLTMVLLGARAARAATIVSASLLLSIPFFHGLPILARTLTTASAGTPMPASVLWAQATGLTGLLVATMVLLDRFHLVFMLSLASLQRQVRERSAEHARLEREMLERQRLEYELARVGDEERRRLGIDIHDGVCQQITGALLRCEALQRRLGRGETLVVQDLAALASLLEEAIDEAHAVARGLCPLEPDPAALASALQLLVRRIQKATGIPCRFTVAGDVSVHDVVAAQHLYRIAQEALSNATRHAHASQVAVMLRAEEGQLVLEVEDDGVGVPERTSTTGMGLRTMASRTHMLRGDFAVTAVTAGGTRVSCRVPHDLLCRQDEQPQTIREDNHAR
jgi:signal transduction histidine kinase